MADKKEIYNLIKIGGLLSYIPVVLGAAPLGGYFLGEYIKNRFGLGNFVLYVLIGAGILTGIREAVRIIRAVSRMIGDI